MAQNLKKHATTYIDDFLHAENTFEIEKYTKTYKILDVTITFIRKLLCFGLKMVYNHLSLPQHLQDIYENKDNSLK